MAAWSDARLAGYVLVAPLRFDHPADGPVLAHLGVGGVVLFGATVPADLEARLSALHTASSPRALVMVDEEGGAIQRLASVVGSMPSARTMGATLDPTQIRALAARTAARLRALGVDVDLAPVLDLDDGPGPDATHPVGTRSFGTDPDLVAADALAFAHGLSDARIVPVVKHFPGLGGATSNTDTGAAATLPWSTLRSRGLRPFAAAVHDGIGVVMVSQATVPGLTSLPASLSPSVIGTVLRGSLGFRGVVMTDSLSAGALGDAGYTVPSAAVAALRAGADVLLIGGGTTRDPVALTTATRDGIVRAVRSGTLSRSLIVEAATRLVTLAGVDLCASAR